MTIEDLAKELNSYYEIGLDRKDSNAFIQCFGIKYASYITQNKIRPKDIIANSELKPSYAREIIKGMKLAKYVTLNKDFLDIVSCSDK